MSAGDTHVFVDLDDSLFWSKRRLDGRETIGVTTKMDGTPYGYMTAASETFLSLILGAQRVIPITARVSTSLARVKLPFSDYRICCHGAVILTDAGQVDDDWLDDRSSRLRDLTAHATDIADLCRALPAAKGLRVVVRADHGLEFYCTVRDPGRNVSKLAAFVDEVRTRIPDDWVLNATDSDAVLRPNFLTKGSAINWLYSRRLKRPDCIVGLGDRDDDKDFLGLCDYVVLPKSSMLWAALEGQGLASNG
ncbi:MAG: hypothetical protein CMH52_07395 [Myxococcales bacterium]|nr:hypothetical protein [Myxococcales bacterium]